MDCKGRKILEMHKINCYICDNIIVITTDTKLISI